MKIIFVTGDHPRHSYMARQLHKTGFLSTVIVQKREEFNPKPPENLDEETKNLFMHHFSERNRVENEMFGEKEWPDSNILEVNKSELNSSKMQTFLKKNNPDLLFSYGCNILSDDTLACVNGEKWNCHGGLSPWYKGSATHFWPSYMLEPQYTGVTIHDLIARADAGSIVHQCTSDLVRGDSLHMLGARSIIKISSEIPKLIALLQINKNLEKKVQKTSGMLWLDSKWKPHHLHLIYKTYNDNIVDLYLDGEFPGKNPKLHRQDINKL